MPPKRPKRPSRLAWFALDVDAFLEDPRMQHLTNREKGAWVMMMIRSFHNKGMMSVEPNIVAEQTGLTRKETKDLLMKLYQHRLLTSTPAEERVFDAQSNRMVVEYEVALAAYEQRKYAGSKSAEKHGNTNLKLVK